jgi:hypothetical protein
VRRGARWLAAVFATVPCLSAGAYAQAPARRASIEAGVTVERLVSEYRFENESTFDTPALVPHFFVQHYESTQPWLVARVRYPLGAVMGETTAGYAPERLAFASDIDTFFQPGGDVVTSGTSGDARLRGFSIDQRVGVGRVHGWPIDVRVRYTHRHADFLPADRVVTHTQPPSETREFITTREMTTSHEIRAGMGFAAANEVGGGWRLEGDGVVWPLVRGRLVTELPDKYPGVDIVFDAPAFGGEARVALVRRIGRASLALQAHAGGILPYRHSASLRQHTIGAGVALGLGGRQ